MEAQGAGHDPPRVPIPGMPDPEQAQLFADVAVLTTDAVLVSDRHGTIVWANPAAARMFGAIGELLGSSLTMLFADDGPTGGFGTVLDRVLREERADPFLTTARRREGESFDVEVTPGVRRDGAERVLGVILVLRAVEKAESRLTGREAFFRGLDRVSADVTYVSDKDGRLVYVTPTVTQVLGCRPEDVRAVLDASPAGSGDLPDQEQRRRRVREVPGARDRFTLRLRDAEDRWRWFEETVTNCVEDADIGGIVVHLREVTAEVEAEQSRRDSEARYRAIAETAQEGILAVSPTGDVLFANERLVEILGIPMDQVYALGGHGIFDPDEAADAALRLASRSREAGPERFDFRYQHPRLGRRTLHVSASSLPAADGSVLGSLAMVADVTEQRAAEDDLRRQALHDALTGLPNRLLFTDRLTRAAARQERVEGGVVAVLFLDLDHFKAVNDLHGHEVGDRLLVEVAGRLEQAVRTTDTVARLGGDEFAVICEGADPATASLVASRIHEAFKGPVAVAGEQLPVGVSIGVALSPPYPAEGLLRCADAAMYHAKATARGTVVTYGDELADEATHRLGVTRALREALDAGELPVTHRPLVDLGTGDVVAWEAGVLWDHPTLGRIGSEEAARAADSLGRGDDLDRLILRASTLGFGDLRRRGSAGAEVPLHVTVAAGARRPTALVAAVEDALARTGLPPSCLVVGLDAEVLGRDAGGAELVSDRLAALGVGLLVRGLGREPRLPTRADLSRLRLRGLGLDREVVQRVHEEPAAVRSAHAVVELAQVAGALVYADGVDVPAQVEVLREIGCDVAGGPLWSGTDRPGGPEGLDGSAG
jgi:diguanylate cyclase (GGDEF)-like protein/PAS domain S-box-containing protein